MFRSVYVLLTATGLMLLDAQHRSTDVIVQGGWLFDGVRDDVRRNTGIVMRNGVFVQIDAHVDSRAARNARIITLADDEYVLPGLFDLHAHYAVDVFGDGSGEGRVDEYTVNPLLFLANGVTSTFTADELDPEGLMQARNRIDGGAQIGPRILNSGPYFGTARAGSKNAEITPERIRDDVRMWAAAGV